MVPPAAASAGELRLRIAGFFWVQPCGFAIEAGLQMMIVRVGNMLGIRRYIGKVEARAIRLVWVLIWLCATLPLLAMPYRELNWWRIQLPTLSLVNSLK